MPLCKLHSLIAYSWIRHRVHVLYLVDTHAKKVSDKRLHLLHLCLWERVYDVVKLQHILDSAVNKPCHKGSVLLWQILILVKHTAKHDMRKCSTLINLNKHLKGKLTRIYRVLIMRYHVWFCRPARYIIFVYLAIFIIMIIFTMIIYILIRCHIV